MNQLQTSMVKPSFMKAYIRNGFFQVVKQICFIFESLRFRDENDFIEFGYDRVMHNRRRRPRRLVE